MMSRQLVQFRNSTHAVAEAMVASTSLARRRLLPSQAKVRSATQRRGSSTKPLAVSLRLTRHRERLVLVCPVSDDLRKCWNPHGEPALRFRFAHDGKSARVSHVDMPFHRVMSEWSRYRGGVNTGPLFFHTASLRQGGKQSPGLDAGAPSH